MAKSITIHVCFSSILDVCASLILHCTYLVIFNLKGTSNWKQLISFEFGYLQFERVKIFIFFSFRYDCFLWPHWKFLKIFNSSFSFLIKPMVLQKSSFDFLHFKFLLISKPCSLNHHESLLKNPKRSYDKLPCAMILTLTTIIILTHKPSNIKSL